jgi:hypothetical protein
MRGAKTGPHTASADSRPPDIEPDRAGKSSQTTPYLDTLTPPRGRVRSRRLSWQALANSCRSRRAHGSATPYGSIRVPRVFCLLANSRRRDRSRIDAETILSAAHTAQFTRPRKEYTRDAYAPVRRRRSTRAFEATRVRQSHARHPKPRIYSDHLTWPAISPTLPSGGRRT